MEGSCGTDFDKSFVYVITDKGWVEVGEWWWYGIKVCPISITCNCFPRWDIKLAPNELLICLVSWKVTPLEGL